MDIAKRITELREEAGDNRREFSIHAGHLRRYRSYPNLMWRMNNDICQCISNYL